MKKILVLNCGSSSIKYALYNMDDQSVITSGGIEKIGLPDSLITVKLNGEKHKMEKPVKETQSVIPKFPSLFWYKPTNHTK